jgi:ATP-dependent DNA ligase
MFDILATPPGKIVVEKPLSERRRLLEQFAKSLRSPKEIRLSPITFDRDLAKKWLEDSGPNGTDGVVAKRLDVSYLPGERAMRKVKRLRTADCVVGGFRYESDSNKVGSLLLGLFNKAGKLDHVGFTSTISDEQRPALTKQLERLRAPPGFTGKAPGGSSRWSTERSREWEPLKPELVVEVRFDHVTGQRFRHGTKLMRWRPDKRPDQCTFEQILP